MKTCLILGESQEEFFGEKERRKIEKSILDLIENYEVTEFYSDYRGAFGKICAETVADLKTRFPSVRNHFFSKYTVDEYLSVPSYYDRIEKAGTKTAFEGLAKVLKMVEKMDVCVFGLFHEGSGGVSGARHYAELLKKKTVYFFKKFPWRDRKPNTEECHKIATCWKENVVE